MVLCICFARSPSAGPDPPLYPLFEFQSNNIFLFLSECFRKKGAMSRDLFLKAPRYHIYLSHPLLCIIYLSRSSIHYLLPGAYYVTRVYGLDRKTNTRDLRRRQWEKRINTITGPLSEQQHTHPIKLLLPETELVIISTSIITVIITFLIKIMNAENCGHLFPFTTTTYLL